MPALSLNHINIRAPLALLNQLRDFYCDVLGLQVGDRPVVSSQGYWLYANEHALIHLSVSSPEELRQINTSTTLDHVAFTCTNLAAMSDTLQQLQIAFRHNAVPDSATRQLFFRDPAGNGVELTFSSGE